MIYINKANRNDKKVNRETKFKITNIGECLDRLRQKGTFKGTSYVHDEFWVCKDKPRIRLRRTNTFTNNAIEVSLKYRLSKEQHIRTEVAESLYRGDSEDKASQVIAVQGKYEPKNSYEKVTAVYEINNCCASLNLYPFGAYLEISGEELLIWKVAEMLSLQKDEAIGTNTDETYLNWNKKIGLSELLHIKFGLESK